MANIDDNSDILGGQLRIQPAWTTFGFWVKLAVLLAMGVVCCSVSLYIRARYLSWKEERHRLSLRRKYGIPDNDHRPFNVAWAAVQRAQREKNIASQAERRSQTPHSTGEQTLRHRQTVSTNQDNQRNTNTPTWAPRATSNNFIFPRDLSSNTTPHNYLGSSRASSHRPSSVGPSYDQLPIPSNTYDSSTLDGASATSQRGSPLGNKRGAKRIFHEEEEEEEFNLRQRAREKRARNISLESAQPIDVDEEEDEELEDEQMGSSDDEVSELPTIRRGKKRDRAEAGSTFGGDDGTDDDEARGKSDRQRKRRTVNGGRRSDVHPRGTKRDRDSDAESWSEDEGVRTKNSRKKRGKPFKAIYTDGSPSDTSMEDGDYSTDVLCGGRRIGEEWEVNGVHFKVGPNGDRLRQALVKKARSRYNMPKDSVHPDSQANVEIFVEVWLTEDQYQDAQAQQILAWQDSTPSSPSIQSMTDMKNSSSVPGPQGGKNLIWSAKPASRSSSMMTRVPSTDATLSTMIRRPLRQSLTGNMVSQQPRVNPFHQPPETPSRRISSIGLGDSINNTPDGAASPVRLGGGRSYSKWEKQELEAATMRKIRGKLEEAKKKKDAAVTPPTTMSSPALTSTIAFPKPGEKPAEKESKTSISGPTAPAPVVSAKSPAPVISAPAAAPSAAIPSITTATTPTPSFFSTPAPTAAPSEKPKPVFGMGGPPPQPAAQAPQAAPSAFSFPKPAPQQTPAPAAPTPFSFSATPQSEKKPEPSMPLLSRISAQAPSPALSKPAPTFSFAKPVETTTATTPANMSAPSNTTIQSTAATPKFNFGIGSTPKVESTGPAQARVVSPQGGLGGSTVKSVVDTTTPISATTPSSTTSTTGTGFKFNFGAQRMPTPTPAQDAKPSAPTSTAGPATASSFSFGKPTETTGATKSAFSFAPTLAQTPSTEAPKPPFSFPAVPAASSSSGDASTTTGPSFAFGAPAPAPTTSKTFSFGATPASGGTSNTPSAFGTSAFGAPASGAPSPFGASTQSTPSNTASGSTVFSFGNSSASSPFVFGSAGQKQESK